MRPIGRKRQQANKTRYRGDVRAPASTRRPAYKLWTIPAGIVRHTFLKLSVIIATSSIKSEILLRPNGRTMTTKSIGQYVEPRPIFASRKKWYIGPQSKYRHLCL
jgi:hypothetical protein